MPYGRASVKEVDMPMKPTYEELEMRVQELELAESNRRQVEDTLEIERQRLTNILWGTNVGTWEWNVQTGETRFNERWAEIIGYTLEELQPVSLETWRKYCHPDDLGHSDDALKKYFNGETNLYKCEVRLRHKDGSWVWILDHGRVVSWTQDGKPLWMYGTHLDINEHKRFEEELRGSEAFLKNVFDAIQDGISVLDTDLRILRVNKWMERMYIDEAPLIGKNCYVVYQKRDTPCPWCPSLKSIETGEPSSSIVPYPSEQKPTGWIDLTSFPIKDKYGYVVGIIEYVKDITNQKKAEVALQQSEERYRSLIENTLDGYFICDIPSGRFIFLNQRIYDLFGYTPKGGLDLTIWDIIAPDSHYLINEKIQSCVEGKVSCYASNICEAIRKDGFKFMAEVSASFVTYKDKLVMQGILRDVTEKERLQLQLQQALKMEGIGTLAGGIAHDFNNILSPIMMHSEMVMYDLAQNDPLRHSMKEIYQAGERARDLVKQILTFARKRSEEKVVLKSSLIINDAIKFLRSTIPTTIDIRYDVNVKHDTILADPTQLNQIVINLCTNAVYAMRQNGGLLEVILDNEEVSVKKENGIFNIKPGRYLRLIVSDNGTGIPDDVINRIFEPYYTTKGPGEGTGLGLAIIHGIVQNYGGDICVDSEVGKGTTFQIYLPLVEAEAMTLKEKIVELQKGDERILIVDDEKSAVTIMQKLLERYGYKVTAKTSSIEALEVFQKNATEFDLVITDMTMPNMTGEVFAKKLKAIRSEIPVILCTGYNDKIDEDKAKEIGICSFIMKPIVMSEMAKIIRNILDDK